MTTNLSFPSAPSWAGEGLCAQIGGDDWFPEKGGSPREAKRVCNGHGERPPCPVREACLQFALANDDRFGIWGGLSERERRRLKQARAAAPAPVVAVVPEPEPTPAPVEAPARRIRPSRAKPRRHWADEELAAAVQQLRGYGMSYQEMATQLDAPVVRVRAAVRQVAA